MNKLLPEICDIKVGYQARSGIHENPAGNYRLIQARDFDPSRQLRWDNLIRFSPPGEPDRYSVQQGDILFLARGMGNFAYPIAENPGSVLAANSFYILRTRDQNVTPLYIAWWLNQPPAQEYIKTQRGGSSIQFISMARFSQLKIPIPPLETQNKIIQLEALRAKEANLTLALLQAKARLIQIACLKAIHS